MGAFDLSFMTRKKVFTDESLGETNLNRVLGVLDVLSIGIGSTLGSGIYILSGAVIKNLAGPATVLAFIIAGIGTFFSGLSYAELGSRVPRSGSAFVYIYVTIGEMFAFMMGWDLVLEYIISVASTSNALSGYIDSLVGNRIEEGLMHAMPMHSPGLGPYVNLFAFAIAIVVTVLMIVGVRESTFLNKIFTVFNIIVLVFIIVAGATRSNSSYWHIDVHNLSWVEKNKTMTCESAKCGSGGFTPFGIDGLIGGAAKCFYAFIGFDAIASTGEELNNPRRNIPLSILLTLLITGSLYCGLSIVLTFMTPYYLMDTETPLPFAFDYVNLGWCKYIATVGAVISLSTCLYSGMFPMPRIVYTMACDGLLFKPFSAVLPKLKTPWVASLVTGIIGGILAAIFDLNELVDMLSIGTLMAYTFVSICVLVLRYRPKDYVLMKSDKDRETHMDQFRSNESFVKSFVASFFNPSDREPTLFTSRISNILILLCIIHLVVIAVLVSVVKITHVYLIVIVVILAFNVLVMTISLYRQPVNIPKASFVTPLVPFLPLLSVFINVYMMTTLTAATWYRFVIWFVFGLIVYFGYGKNNSFQNPNRENEYWCCCLPCLGKVGSRSSSSTKHEEKKEKLKYSSNEEITDVLDLSHDDNVAITKL